MNADDAVSDVLGTILLFAVVVLFVGTITVFALAFVQDFADEEPRVDIQETTLPYYLYHAGGDPLKKSEIRIYSLDYDITDDTRINGKKWEVWKTGDLLSFQDFYDVSDVIIVGTTSRGREVILYNGLKKVSG